MMKATDGNDILTTDDNATLMATQAHYMATLINYCNPATAGVFYPATNGCILPRNSGYIG